jgi:hypothetical protein
VRSRLGGVSAGATGMDEIVVYIRVVALAADNVLRPAIVVRARVISAISPLSGTQLSGLPNASAAV